MTSCSSIKESHEVRAKSAVIDGCSENGHWTCSFPDCRKSYEEHAFSDTRPRLEPICLDCSQSFNNLYQLNGHATSTGHSPYLCYFAGCDARFSRHDALERHVTKHKEPRRRYECPHCYRHDGEKAFRRRDHLVQHLRGYHNIGIDAASSKATSCPYPDCEHYRIGAYAYDGSPIPSWQQVIMDDTQAFKTRKAFQDHMRKGHDQTPYQCLAQGCDRRGAKGWFREKDLAKHQQKEHGGKTQQADLPTWFST